MVGAVDLAPSVDPGRLVEVAVVTGDGQGGLEVVGALERVGRLVAECLAGVGDGPSQPVLLDGEGGGGPAVVFGRVDRRG